MNNINKPKVSVLLSAYNGAKYIAEQIDSLLAQENVSCSIIVRDDGSNDGTQTILTQYQERELINWYQGKNVGVAKSFWDLLINAPNCDYYAFCDQDDIWLPNKLDVSIRAICKQKTPALYCSNLKMVDATGKTEIIAPSYRCKHTFGETFIRNVKQGCTMLFNHALMLELRKYTPYYFSLHDSWVRRVCFSIGGYVEDGVPPLMLYRQHGGNVVGGKQSFSKMLSQNIKSWTYNKNARLLIFRELYAGYSDSMQPENRRLVEKAIHYQESLWNKLSFMFDPNINTGVVSLKIKFMVSVLLNKY